MRLLIDQQTLKIPDSLMPLQTITAVAKTAAAPWKAHISRLFFLLVGGAAGRYVKSAGLDDKCLVVVGAVAVNIDLHVQLIFAAGFVFGFEVVSEAVLVA